MEPSNNAQSAPSAADSDGRAPGSAQDSNQSRVAVAEKPKSADAAQSTSPGSPHKFPKKLILFSLLGVAAIVGAVFGWRWWQYASTHQETDNAYISGDIHPVTARISGTVTAVPVRDNQNVASGALLVKLDPRDSEVSLQQAQAALQAARHQADVAQANIGVVATNAAGQTTVAQGNIDAASASVSTAEAAVSEAQAGIPAAQAQLAQVEANLVKTQQDYQRYAQLNQQGAAPTQQLDAARAAYEATLAQRNAAEEQVKQSQAKVVQAQKNLNNAQAKLAATRGDLQQASATGKQTEANRRQYQAALSAIAQAEAQVKNAQLQLSYTNIAAPIAGRIGNKTVEVGQRVQPGQTLMSIVEEQPWVVANFKETQLEKMQPGQEVEIKIDAFPHLTFRGRVDSVAPASGAKFALLPPDNATGNFTKIVQRIPVKVVFDSDSIRGYEARITPGMSVVVSVATP